MSRMLLQNLIRRVEQMAIGTGENSPADDLLLKRFILENDENAFEVLLNRHARLVWAVCRGLLLGDSEAEDAFQATFLALIQNAKQIRETKTIAPWLHGTATKIAKKARLAAARRSGREKKVAKQEASDQKVPDSSWDRVSLIVHEEIGKLPTALRGAFVICVLEGERHHDAAIKLGVPIGTISARVSRARQKLLDRLNLRGLVPGMAIAAIALDGTSGPAAVPQSILDSVRYLVLNGFSSVSTSITTLATTATEGTTMKAKVLAAAILIGGALTFTGGSMLFNRAEGQSQPVQANPVKPQPQADPLSPVPADANKPTKESWKYSYSKRPENLSAFQKLLASKSAEGWEYVSSETFHDESSTEKIAVFKMPVPVTYAVYPNPIAVGSHRFENTSKLPESVTYSNLPTQEQPVYEVIPLVNTKAADVVNALNQHVKNSNSTLQNRVRFVAEQVSNSLVIMNADPKSLEDLKSIVRKLDASNISPPIKPEAKSVNQELKLFQLKHASAEIAIQQIQQIYQKSKNAPAGEMSITPDVRTNSILVYATKSKLDEIEQIIRLIDVKNPAAADSSENQGSSTSTEKPLLYERYDRAVNEAVIVYLDRFVKPSQLVKALDQLLNERDKELSKRITMTSDDAKHSITIKGPKYDVQTVKDAVLEFEKEVIQKEPDIQSFSLPKSWTGQQTNKLLTQVFGTQANMEFVVEESSKGLFLRIKMPKSKVQQLKDTIAEMEKQSKLDSSLRQ